MSVAHNIRPILLAATALLALVLEPARGQDIKPAAAPLPTLPSDDRGTDALGGNRHYAMISTIVAN